MANINFATGERRRTTFTDRLTELLDSQSTIIVSAKALRRINATIGNKIRVARFRHLGAKIGENVFIHRKAVFSGSISNLSIDDESYLGASEYYLLDKLQIGKRVLVGEQCYLCTGSHAYNEDFRTISAPIVIGNDVWIATASAVFGGSVVKDGAIVGAYTVVRGMVEANEVVIGNPASSKGKRADAFRTHCASNMGSANSDILLKACIKIWMTNFSSRKSR